MPDVPSPDPLLDALAAALADARLARVADVQRLDELSGDELAYLSRLGELPDPETDGLECR